MTHMAKWAINFKQLKQETDDNPESEKFSEQKFTSHHWQGDG